MNKLKYGSVAVGFEGSQARFEALCEDYRKSNLDFEYEKEIASAYKNYCYTAIIPPTDDCPYWERMFVMSNGNSLLLGEQANTYYNEIFVDKLQDAL